MTRITHHASPTAVALALCVSALPPAARAVRAQSEAGPPPPGTARLSVTPAWWRFARRFGSGTPGLREGQPEPLAVDFNADSVGFLTLVFPTLLPAQASLRTLTGVGDLTLGRTVLHLNAGIKEVPISLDYTVTNRLSLGVTVPIVHSRMDVHLAVDSTSSGWNPQFQGGTTYDGFRSQVDAAVAALGALANDPSRPAAVRELASALLDRVSALMCGLATAGTGAACGTTGALAPFLPLASTPAGDSITARLGRAQQDYALVRTLLADAGVALPAFTAAFTLPPRAPTAAELQRVVTGSTFGLSAESLGTNRRTRVGDIELRLTYRLLGRAPAPATPDQPREPAATGRYRATFAAAVRLPTGRPDSPDNFVDLGNGDGQTDLDFRLYNELRWGGRFSLQAGARYAIQLPDRLPRRVAAPNAPVTPASRLAMVRRDLGDVFQAAVLPTWRFGDAMSLQVGATYYRRTGDRFSYVSPADSSRIGLPAAVLETETAARWLGVAADLAYATTDPTASGTTPLPFEVIVSYHDTLWGRGGAVPKASGFRVAIRLYYRVS